LIFVPLFFSRNFLNQRHVLSALTGFGAFCAVSSIVYIINDLRDRDKDRLHPVKCRRPLASGALTTRHAAGAIAVLALVTAALSFTLLRRCGNAALLPLGLLALYLLLNIGYSAGLKNIPLVDVTILAAGYVLRVLAGALIIGTEVSVWLYLTVTLGAYYMGLGKRRNEIVRQGKTTRSVMRFYTHNFLDKNMYMCQALCLVFYALWSIDAETVKRFGSAAFVYTIPLVLIILLKYSLNIEGDSDGDPTSVVLHDKALMFLCLAYLAAAFCIIYVARRTA
jgi:4-hydroxybenzoate polyprenyltransferase